MQFVPDYPAVKLKCDAIDAKVPQNNFHELLGENAPSLTRG